MRSIAAACAVLLGLVAGCAPVSSAPAGDAGAPGVPVALQDAVRADAAQRAAVALANVRIARAEAVTWRDGSLGCPRPGLAYTQALVPGWRLWVEAGGTRLDYHAARENRWLVCPAGQAEDPLPRDAMR